MNNTIPPTDNTEALNLYKVYQELQTNLETL